MTCLEDTCSFFSFTNIGCIRIESQNNSAQIYLKEISDGRTSVCATISLDHPGSDINTRLGNIIYSSARAGRLVLPAFPDVGPILRALKNGPSADEKSYKVSAQVHDHLVLLGSLAQKWLDESTTRARAEEVIATHNERFNKDGMYLMTDRTKLSNLSLCNLCNI